MVENTPFRWPSVPLDSVHHPLPEASVDTELENCHMPSGSPRSSGWWIQRWRSCRFHRNRRHCRRGRRHHQTVVPSHLPPRCRTLPSRLQVRHARRQAASTVKATRAHSNYFSAVLTGLFSFLYPPPSSPIYFCCILFSTHVPPETWSLCRGTHRNSVDTFQHFTESFADCNYSNKLSVYTVMYMCPSGKTVACNFRLVFINFFFFFLLFCRKMDLVLFC